LFELGKAFPAKFLTEKWADLGLQIGQSVILSFPQTRRGSPADLAPLYSQARFASASGRSA
jgi:hypothetical protein